MEQARHPSRPMLTDDLLRRLGSSDTDSKEVMALEAWSKEMVQIFRDERWPSYMPEAAALAPITTISSYQDLSQAFSKAMISGTADRNILEPQLLKGFTYVLHCSEGLKKAKVELGPIMASLQTRLQAAVEQAEPKTQYQLVNTLSSVLDAMIDIKTTGLSREALHEPLLKRLAALSKHQELRLAQAAEYAYQALLSIPDDEGPYKALWRHALPLVAGVAELAGAVSTMDLAKLFNGLTKLQDLDLSTLISSMIDVVKALSGTADSLGGAVDGVTYLRKQKSWYVALRFTDMLIQAKAFNYLEEFTKKLPCLQKEPFLCGFYAQLERAWGARGIPAKDQIVQFLNKVLVPAGSKSTHQRVYEWIKLVADTIGQPAWRDAVQPVPQLFNIHKWKKNKYASTIPYWETRNEILPTDLLNKAWLRCVTARVFYADIKIREHYLQNHCRLMVERLSGRPLPMDQCYINLAIVEHYNNRTKSSDEKAAKNQFSPFPLLTRLKVESQHQDTQVSLPSLFTPRKRRDGREAPPERILIRGQAGVGKTTLCKKMLHDYLHGKIWPFERLIWVPLRMLKGRKDKLKDWLCDEYFRNGDGEIWAEAVRQAVNDPDKYGKTLFILDGLDEVSRELDSETPGLLLDLLNQPHVIITSRPGKSFASINQIDLELETVGFYPDQVDAYIKKIAPDHAGEIQSFVRENWLVQGLVRIPIQLEALCYIWDTKTANSGRVPTTMATFYQEIELKLWRKDAARLGKLYGGMPFSEEIAKKMLDSEILSHVMPEVNLLWCLAFTGLYSDVIEFDKQSKELIWEHWNDILEGVHPTGAPPSSLDLAKLSFLRTSGTSSDEMNQSYHFLHLTFQEYFAAQYFVEHWKSGKLLLCLVLGSGDSKSVSAEDFLLNEKYNARYDIFWRFVAGLLQSHKAGEQLHHFFDTIEKEPRDLLGPTHQRLVMHCLSEVVPSEKLQAFTALRTNLEDQLSRWLIFECNFMPLSNLPGEMELPELVLDHVLRTESWHIRIRVLNSLSTRPKIPLSIINLAASWLRDDIPPEARLTILDFLRRPHEALPDDILKDVATQLEIWAVRTAAVWTLRSHESALSEEILKAVAARLKHQKWYVREAALKALQGQSALREEILKDIAILLEDQDSEIGAVAVQILEYQSILSRDILKDVAIRLERQGWYTREAAATSPERQSSLDKGILKTVAAQHKPQDNFFANLWELDNGGFVVDRYKTWKGQDPTDDWNTLRVEVDWAFKALENQSTLPEKDLERVFEILLESIEKRLEHADYWLFWRAAEAIERQSAFPEKILSRAAKGLYLIWLQRSFQQHLSCCIIDEIVYIDKSEGVRKVYLEGQQDQFREAIQGIPKEVGVPLPSALKM